MTYVIAEPCIGVKDRSCVDVCPVDCIYEDEDQLYIHPDECIDCGACVPECPVTAIFDEEEVPPNWASYTAKNRDVFKSDQPPAAPKR
jgi:ferredoxin